MELKFLIQLKNVRMNVNKIIFLFFFSIIFCQTEEVSGFLREVEMSFCMDECGEYYIETFENMYWPVIFNDDMPNINLYTNRYVEVLIGEDVTCTECSAYKIESIVLSNDCISPTLCIADPCELASECQINTPTECISNYCGGCNADFYDLDNNLVNCNLPVDECEDLSGLDFGECAMVLGIGYVDGECNYVSGCSWHVDGIDYTNAFHDDIDQCNEQCNSNISCDDIQESYLELHFGQYSECEYDVDCMPIWGHCDVSLGGCHYAVNITNYPEDEINEQVELWLENECVTSVCDCMNLPYTVCLSGSCQLVSCNEPNPAGCFQTGCPDGYECVFDTQDCTSSSCYCQNNNDFWTCTEDCGGGTCLLIEVAGDINGDTIINILDIVLIVSFILIINDPTDSEFSSADINSDELLNVLDIVEIVQIILNPIQLPEGCYLEPETGPCFGYCPTYYFNNDTNECEEFITGCCGLEAFNTFEACQNACE